MDLNTYQALAQQVEQIADLLLADHADRIRFRHDVMRALAELKQKNRAASEDSDHLTISKSTLSTVWNVAKTLGPWLLTAGVTLFHFLSHLKGV
jgi:hypothetical protein